VAVKALSLQSMSDWKQLDLFQREANTLKQLQHPGIPRYVADFEDDTEKDRGYYLVQVSSKVGISHFLLVAWPFIVLCSSAAAASLHCRPCYG
jgi:serine/threonine protein kinase